MPDYPMSMINQALIQRIESRFTARFGTPPDHIARAPGRVNFLGEHVDYNQGLVIPAAIDRATYVAFSPSPYSESTILADDFSAEVSFSSDSVKAKEDVYGHPMSGWSLYPAGVMKHLGDNGINPAPIHAVFASDVPRGAGLSSSASVETAFITSWLWFAGIPMPPMEQALLCQRAENDYLGVRSGLMDQFASIFGMENQLLLLDCQSLEWQSMPLPEAAVIIVADTGVRRELTSGEYNQRRAECEEAVQYLRQDLQGIHSLRDLSLGDYNRLSHKLPAVIQKRARHVVEEIARVNQAWQYLATVDLIQFGKLMNDCHSSLRDLYEVSCPELDAMAGIAQSLDGCLGARLTGAGFGGCCVCLVNSENADAFEKQLTVRYQAAIGIKPDIFITHVSRGAGLVR